MWACFTVQRSLHFPSLEASFLPTLQCMQWFPPPPPPTSRSPPRSGCLTTAPAVQECLPYNVTHITKRESALLLLCKEPLSSCRSLSSVSLFFRFGERPSLRSESVFHISCCCKHKHFGGRFTCKNTEQLNNKLPVFTSDYLKLERESFYV